MSERVVLRIALPMDLGAFGTVLQLMADEYPGAELRNTDDDTVVEVFLPGEDDVPARRVAVGGREPGGSVRQPDDDDACPDDPDGQHHIGCGCENSDFLD